MGLEPVDPALHAQAAKVAPPHFRIRLLSWADHQGAAHTRTAAYNPPHRVLDVDGAAIHLFSLLHRSLLNYDVRNGRL
jgi:hypothetical protein